MLGCWSRICCTSLQRSAAEGGRAVKLGPLCGSLRLSQRCGPSGPTSPKPPPLERSGRPGPRPEPACQPGVQLEPDVTGLTSPAAALSVAPPTPPTHTVADCPPGLTEAPPLLERPVRGHLAGPAGRTGRGSGAHGVGMWLRFRGSGGSVPRAQGLRGSR